MLGRAEHDSEAITGLKNARRYADAHEKAGTLVYHAFLRDIKKLNLTGRGLEVGAGPGILAAILAAANPDIHITAIDLSADMAAVATENIRAKGLAERIDYRVCDAGDARSLDRLGAFDFVYSTFSLHHWNDAASTIGNLWRLLRDGGILYIHDFKRVWWARLLPLGKGDRESIGAAYLPREMDGFLAELGVGDYEIKTLFPFFLMSLLARKPVKES